MAEHVKTPLADFHHATVPAHLEDRPKKGEVPRNAPRAARRLADAVSAAYARFLTAAGAMSAADTAAAVATLPAGLQASTAQTLDAMRGAK